MSNGNSNRNCPQSKGQKCAGAIRYYNTSGRPVTTADLLCPRNVEYSFDQASSENESDFSESNNSNSSTTPFVARGRQFNPEHEIQRIRNETWQRWQAKKAADSCIRPPSPLRTQATQQQCPNSGVTKHVDCRREILPRARSPGQKSLYDYNTQAHTPHGAAGRPLDVQRDITSRLNLPTSKKQRATSCPTPMQHNSTLSKSGQQKAQPCLQTVSTVYPNLYRSTSPRVARRTVFSSTSIRTPVKDNSITAKSSVSPAYEKVQRLHPRSVTKTITRITRTTTPAQGPPKSPLITASNRSPEKNPDSSQRQGVPTNSSRGQDMMRLIDQTYKQMPQRGFATPPTNKTPPQPPKKTTEFASPSFQRQDNSNIYDVAEKVASNSIFNVPQAESTRHHETVNIPRMINDIILSDEAFPISSFQRRDNIEQMGQAFGQTPQRGLATMPAYKTPPQPSNMMTQLASTSLQRPENSDIPYAAQTPQSEATHQYESINIKTPPRPNTLINETGLPQVATPTSQSLPPPSSLPSGNVSHNNNYASVEQSSRNLFSSPSQNTTNQQPTDQFHSNLSSKYVMDQSYDRTTSRNHSTSKPFHTSGRPTLNEYPDADPYDYNASKFNEPSALENHRRIECPKTTFEGLRADSKYHNLSMDSRSRRSPARPATKHDTRYVNETMDCSARVSPTRTPCPIKHDTRYTNKTMDISESKSPTRAACPKGNSCNMRYWQIPQENICKEYEDQNPEHLNSTAINRGIICQVEDMLGPEFESTSYLGLPTREPFQLTEKQTEPTSAPDANLFRCVAKKLSATYDFLSSFITTPQSPKSITLPPVNAQQRSGQYCDATTSEPNTQFRTPCLREAMDLPASLRECANAKRCGRVQFEDLDKFTDQDSNRTTLRKIQIENLVSDNYCPGLIQDTVDGREDFNKHSLNITMNDTTHDRPSAEEPMTLLEAFSIRIEKERSKIETKIAKDAAEESTEDTIQKYFEKLNPTDLNHSIKSLLLSEYIEEHELDEQAKEKSFKADVQKLITTSTDNHRNKLYIYTGLTKPSDEEPSI